MTPLRSGEAIALLAPAAGNGMGKQVAARLLARADWLDLFENAIVGALTATNRYYDKTHNEWVIYPDGKTRLAAVLGIWSHLEGDPVKRVIHQHLGPGGPSNDLAAALIDSPELLQAIEQTIAEAKRAASARPVELVDLDGN